MRFLVKKASALDDVVRLLVSDAGLGLADKNRLVDGLKQLSTTQAEDLRSLLFRAGGASVGALIARFLAQNGLLGTAIGAGIGYGVGAVLDRMTSPQDDFGFPKLIHNDAFGRPY